MLLVLTAPPTIRIRRCWRRPRPPPIDAKRRAVSKHGFYPHSHTHCCGRTIFIPHFISPQNIRNCVPENPPTSLARNTSQMLNPCVLIRGALMQWPTSGKCRTALKLCTFHCVGDEKMSHSVGLQLSPSFLSIRKSGTEPETVLGGVYKSIRALVPIEVLQRGRVKYRERGLLCHPWITSFQHTVCRPSCFHCWLPARCLSWWVLTLSACIQFVVVQVLSESGCTKSILSLRMPWCGLVSLVGVF